MRQTTSGLELEWRHLAEPDPHYPSGKWWLEYVIDGQSLGNLVPGVGHPYCIGCLGWMESEEDDLLTKQLVGDEPSDLETKRTRLYACWICGDISCGAITTELELAEDRVIWKNFGFENDYDVDESGSLVDFSDYEAIGPFTFDKNEYRKAILNRPSRPEPSQPPKKLS